MSAAETPDDVEVVTEVLRTDDAMNDRDCATRILAALNLPGRMKALREETAAAQKQWERCLDEALVVTAERDAVRGELHDAIEFRRAEQRRLSADALRAADELATVNEALNNVTDLLDEARTERDEARAEVERYRAELRGMGRAIAGDAP